jgi:patatin-like phospholipase/acyl hydrolase
LKYNKDGIENILKEYFKDIKLSDCITDVIIPAYETELRRPFFFKSSDSHKVGYDFFIWEIARATSAAPTYFEPYKIQTQDLCGYHSLIDGGVFANNPSMCAYIDAKNHHLRKYNKPEKNERLETDERICVISIGTGQLTKALRYDTIKNWGLWFTRCYSIGYYN